MIPDEAIAAAKEAMREVTPPPGVSQAEWLAEHGSFALIAGAIAAAAPYIKAQAVAHMIKAAKAEGWDEGRANGGWQAVPTDSGAYTLHPSRNPYRKDAK